MEWLILGHDITAHKYTAMGFLLRHFLPPPFHKYFPPLSFLTTFRRSTFITNFFLFYQPILPNPTYLTDFFPLFNLDHLLHLLFPADFPPVSQSLFLSLSLPPPQQLPVFTRLVFYLFLFPFCHHLFYHRHHHFNNDFRLTFIKNPAPLL